MESIQDKLKRMFVLLEDLVKYATTKHLHLNHCGRCKLFFRDLAQYDMLFTKVASHKYATYYEMLKTVTL